jgi:hypothetical protein
VRLKNGRKIWILTPDDKVKPGQIFVSGSCRVAVDNEQYAYDIHLNKNVFLHRKSALKYVADRLFKELLAAHARYKKAYKLFVKATD